MLGAIRLLDAKKAPQEERKLSGRPPPLTTTDVHISSLPNGCTPYPIETVAYNTNFTEWWTLSNRRVLEMFGSI